MHDPDMLDVLCQYVFGAENRQHIEIKWAKTGKEWVAMGKEFFSVSCRTVSLHVPSFNGLHCKFTKIVPFILGWGNDVIDIEYRRHSYSSAISTRVKITTLSFDAFFSSFPLAESSPRELQITAYK